MIPVCTPLITEADTAAVTNAVSEGWVSADGPYVAAFEEAWAAECQRDHGIAVANGTAALQLAIAALDLPPGSEIIIPSFTIMSCALAAVYNNLVPVFVDCHADTWTMNEDAVAEAITEKTRAIMIVHMYGHPCHMDPLLELAKKHSLKVVEDAAQTHGAMYRGQPCGSFGDVSCFSFYANKIITTGEGGMVVTDNPLYAEKIRQLRNLSHSPKQRFYHDELGYNYRMTSMQAALGTSQSQRLQQLVDKKRDIAARYTEAFSDIASLQLPTEKSWAHNVFWMYGIVIDASAGLDATAVIKQLRDCGIGARSFFIGLHQQPALINKFGTFTGDFSVTEKISQQGLYLPSGLNLLDGEDIQQVIKVVRQIFEVAHA